MPIPGIGDISGGAGGLNASSSASSQSGSIGNSTTFNIAGQPRKIDYTQPLLIAGAIVLAGVIIWKVKK